MAGHRRPARLLHGRLRRRLAADPHLRPAALVRLGAALERRAQGPQPVRLERLLRLSLRLFASAGCPRGALLPLPEDLAAGRLLGLRPVAEPARHRAHRPRPLAGVGLAPARLAARALLRPALHGPDVADAGHEVAVLRPAVGRSWSRSSRNGAASPACSATRGSSMPSTWCSSTRASRRPTRGFQGAHKPIVEADEKSLKPQSDQLEEAPNLSQIERGYWLSGNPLPVTEQNLMRGKEVFLDRCVGCHGLKGNGKGPGRARSSRRLRPTSPTTTTPAVEATPGPGDFYYRILRGWPGTAMENFGDRLSVNDIWRVVLFLKTIPNGTLEPNRIPEPRDYIVWQPSEELRAWVTTHQRLSGQRGLRQEDGFRPVLSGGHARLPGPRTRRHDDAERRQDRAVARSPPPQGSRPSTRTCSTAPGGMP